MQSKECYWRERSDLLVPKEKKVLLTTRGGDRDSGESSSFAFGDENSFREIRLKPPFDAFATSFRLRRGGGDDNSTFMMGVLTENIICCRLLFWRALVLVAVAGEESNVIVLQRSCRCFWMSFCQVLDLDMWSLNSQNHTHIIAVALLDDVGWLPSLFLLWAL